jgi:NitT/TauT family transport system ATP-binding protein
MIRIEQVSKHFRERSGSTYTALDRVHLHVEKGEFVALLGPSGCGKSTLLNLISGLDKADEGQVLYKDQPCPGPGPDRVVVFQEHALFPWLTVLENVAFGLKQKGMSKVEREAIAMEKIKQVHLSKFTDRYPHELSGGMRQRAAIARALAMDPDMLLMDEPFSALDEQTRFILHKDVEEIWLETKKTIVFVTHNIREAVMLADRVIVMSTRPGRIKKEFHVHAARPRNAADTVLHYLEAQIMECLEEELEKVLKEEMGDDYRIQKGDLSGRSDDLLGGGI